MIRTEHLPPAWQLHRYFALLASEAGAAMPFVLYTYSARHQMLAAVPVASKEEAWRHLPDRVIELKRARGDHASLITAWAELGSDLRALVHSDVDAVACAAAG